MKNISARENILLIMEIPTAAKTTENEKIIPK